MTEKNRKHIQHVQDVVMNMGHRSVQHMVTCNACNKKKHLANKV